MAEPTSAYSVWDLMLRVAKAASVAYYGSSGTSRAMVPIDDHNFERVLDAVNDGIKFFIASAPPTGWRWMNRQATVTFDSTGGGASNISSDAARYQLDDDFQGEVAGDITYIKDTNLGRITWVHESEIRRLREITVTTGDANRAAVLPYTGRRWELIVDPQPQSNQSVTFPYKAGFAAMQARAGDASGGSSTTLVDSSLNNLYPDDYFNSWTIYVKDGTGKNSYAIVTDYTGASGTFTVADWLAIDGSAGGTDPAANSVYFVTNGTTHPAGMQFDEAVLSACLAKAELEFEDLQVGYMDKFLSKDLPDAWNIDARSAPRKLGPMLPGNRYRSNPVISDERYRNDVTYS